VKLRTKVTKGAGSKKAALAMAYKLLDAAQERWRRFNGHELVTDVLEDVKFKDGIRPQTTKPRQQTRGRRLMLHFSSTTLDIALRHVRLTECARAIRRITLRYEGR